MVREGSSAWYRAEAENLRALAAKVRSQDIQAELIRIAAQFDVLAIHAAEREPKD